MRVLLHRVVRLGMASVLCCAAGPRLSAAFVEPAAGYTAVQGAFLREDFEEAVVLAQSFILQNPTAEDVPRVWLWMALSLDRLQQTNEALREISRLKERLAPHDGLRPEVLFWEGDVSRRAFQMVRAKTAYQELLTRYPNSTWVPQAQLGLALIDLHLQAFEPALEGFTAVERRQPGTPTARDARLFAGVCHVQLRQFKKAATVFQSLLAEPQDAVTTAQVAYYLGEALSGLEQYEEAIEAYQRAAQTSDAPQWGRPALFGLGWAAYRLGRCDETVQVFERYLDRSKGDHRIEAMFAQASCLMKSGKESDALSLLEQILSTDAKHPFAAESGMMIADIYRQQGRTANAKALLLSLMHPGLDLVSRGQMQLRLGGIALDEGNAAQAKTLFTLAGETPEIGIRQAALSGLGDVQIFLGKFNDAARYYGDARQLAVDSSLGRYAAYQLGRTHLHAGAFNDAIWIFQQLSSAPEAGLADDARLALALTYLNMDKPALAQSTLNELRARDPDGATAGRAAYYLALLAMQQGQQARARALCEETIEKTPSTDEALDARLLLADVMIQETSTAQTMYWLRSLYVAPGLSRRHRAKLAKRLGDLARGESAYAEAILWYDEAAAMLPTLRGEAVYRIASCYEEAGDADMARRWYGRIDEQPWRVRGQLAAAKLLERDGRIGEAQTIYASLAREELPEAKMAEERLDALREAARHEESTR